MVCYNGNAKYYYHQDGLGSVTALTDNGGYIVERYRYDAFGGPTIIAPNGQQLWYSAYDNPFMFAGMQFDDESWLYYCRARYYRPDIGRFLNPDPIGYHDSMNLYTYVMNNPVMLTDPSGEDTKDSCADWQNGCGGNDATARTGFCTFCCIEAALKGAAKDPKKREGWDHWKDVCIIACYASGGEKGPNIRGPDGKVPVPIIPENKRKPCSCQN
jgi:RHS repeat-associated protein